MGRAGNGECWEMEIRSSVSSFSPQSHHDELDHSTLALVETEDLAPSQVRVPADFAAFSSCILHCPFKVCN